MFNGILKSDDVEVYEPSWVTSHYALSSDCKHNHLIYPNAQTNISLPTSAYIGKVLNFTRIKGVGGTGKGNPSNPCYIRHSDVILFTLEQGTVSFMYVGQQLNGLTATDKSKSGWIILGGVQGDTAITGYAGSVAIGSGAYCGSTYTIAMGYSASANGAYANAMGYSASASGAYTNAIGYSTTASAYSAIAMGYSASASGNYTIAMGYSASASGAYANAIGYYASAITSKLAFKSNLQFSVAGDAQAGKFILMRQTVDATPLVMSATNAAASTTNILILPNNGTYGFIGQVTAKDASTGDSAKWNIDALMKRGANASTTALVGTPTITKVFNDAGAAAWTIALTADTTNGGGAITVTGEAGKTIRFVCNIDSSEVI